MSGTFVFRDFAEYLCVGLDWVYISSGYESRYPFWVFVIVGGPSVVWDGRWFGHSWSSLVIVLFARSVCRIGLVGSWFGVSAVRPMFGGIGVYGIRVVLSK